MNALESENRNLALRLLLSVRDNERDGDADVGLQIVEQEQANAAAGGCQREAFAKTVTGVPGHAAVDKAIELIAAEIAIIQLLIETQFERTREPVIAADLGAAIAASERFLPRLIMLRTVAGISKRAAANTILHAPRPNAGSRGVVRPSPDMLYSICFYLGAAGGAIRVSTHDMPDTYWSVSLFDVDTNNFYALNDRQTEAGAADFVLAAAGKSVERAGLPVVVPPTNRGIVLFRTLINDESRIAEIDAKRQFAACAPYTVAPIITQGEAPPDVITPTLDPSPALAC